MSMVSASKIVGVGRRAAAGRLLAASSTTASTLKQGPRCFSVLESKTDKHLLSEFVGVRGPVAEEVRRT